MYIKLTHADSPFTIPVSDELSNLPEQDIYIECNTAGGTIIVNLPKASSLPFLNPRIKIADAGGVAATNNITIVPDTTTTALTPDTINGDDANQVINTNGGSAILEIVNVDQVSTGDGAGAYQMTVSSAYTGGAPALKRVLVTAVADPTAYAATGDEDIIACDTTAGAINITLAVAARPVKETLIKDEGGNAAAKNITVTAHAGDTLDVATVIVTNKGSAGVYNAGPGTTKNFQYAPNL